MAALERVMQLQGQGLSESQIIDSLRQEGISPKEIYDALTQSQIKSELSQNPQMEYEENTMQPSMIQQNQDTGYENQPQEQQNYPEYTEQQASPQYYPQYQEYQPPQQQATDIETINEIAEQIVEEKNAELKKQILEIKNFKEESKAEIERLSKKIEKLEDNYNELQIAIVRKIGEYGENVKNVAAEMHETQNSFSKILNPLTDNIRELQKITGTIPSSNQKPEENQQQTQPAVRKPRRSEPGFEDYLR